MRKEGDSAVHSEEGPLLPEIEFLLENASGQSDVDPSADKSLGSGDVLALPSTFVFDSFRSFYREPIEVLFGVERRAEVPNGVLRA